MVATILFDSRSKTVKRARDLKESAEQHHNIYRAMRERDPEGASRAMHDHLLQTQQAQRLEEQEASAADDGLKP